ncbi:MAG: tetratricopeptide repeat protein [Pseudomonadota bacterium]
MNRLIILLTMLLLAGCASTGAPLLAAPTALFHDAGFKAPSEPVSTANLFELSPAMRSYAHSPEFANQLRAVGAERGLVAALYKKGELKLEYDSSMTRNAAQAFEARAGNCLSLVIMTAAFAKELEMRVEYQEVLLDENWSRSGALYFASTHVNLSIGRRSLDVNHSGFETSRMLTIDFVPPENLRSLPTRPLEEAEIVAMYMNNRAAEALALDHIDDAYWWARAAVLQYPASITAFNTLGVIYLRHGDTAMAEQVYLRALEREPENTVLMHNLKPVLNLLGKRDEAEALGRRLANIEPYPPFHFFNLGMKAMEKGDFSGARSLFAREVKRAPYYHEFHFWLAIANLRLGNQVAAREQLAQALDTSTTRDSARMYSAKLAYLRGL